MGAREDFDQALHRGDFVAAARAWTFGNLSADAGVQAFETKLAASLEDRQYVLGESLTMANGEYTYLGSGGKDGARLAYLPNDGSLDGITYLKDHYEVASHLSSIGASQLDTETVVAFFAVSERQSFELAQQTEHTSAPQEQVSGPTVAPTATGTFKMSPEEALRALLNRSGDSPELADAVVSVAKRDFKNNRVHVGSIYAYGKAPYKNDPKNPRNFFVSMVGPNEQEETIWGKELEAALVSGGLDTGAAADAVLSHQGVEDVVVPVPERDEKGTLTGNMVQVPARRNLWKAVSLEQLREQAKEQLALQPEAQQVQPGEPALPPQMIDFKKRVQNATWFFDTIEDEAERANGRQSLVQLREDFKALMIEYPQEAAEVWRTEAPTEYQPELADLLAQLENAAPDVIKAHKDHDLAEARQQEGSAVLPGQDSIQAAPVAKSANEAEQDEDAIQPVVLDGGEDKLKKQTVDAISRFGGGNADAISDAGAAKKAEQANAQAQQQGDTAGSPKTLLNGRFVLRDQGQYFRVADGVESTRVALVDEASKIRFVDKQMDTFQAAIELAKHKQWEAILVTGSEKFRAEAWHHARMAGLEVVGYEPTEKDLATLKAAQEGRTKVGHMKAATGPAASPGEADKAKSLKEASDYALGAGYGVSEPKVANGRHVGKVIHETDKHIVQEVGRKIAVVHDKEAFDRQALRAAMEKGKPLKIQYAEGRAGIEGSKERSQERGR